MTGWTPVETVAQQRSWESIVEPQNKETPVTDYTANGARIVAGLRVFTNNLDAATVLALNEDGWHDVRVDGIAGYPARFNGERLTTRNPFTGASVPVNMECPWCLEDLGSFHRTVDATMHVEDCQLAYEHNRVHGRR